MPGPGDEAWTEDDVELALAWKVVTGENCAGCGQPRVESFDPDSEYDTTLLHCHACAAREERAAEFAEDGGSTAGLFMTVRKHPRR